MVKPLRRLGRVLRLLPRRDNRREVQDVTVCIAMAFTWIYGEDDLGRAILTASDRMLTAVDIQYEPSQQKISFLSPTTIILVAGDMTAHTEALMTVQRVIGPSQTATATTETIAHLYFGSDPRN